MFLIKLSPKSYLSYNYIIHTQKKIMCVCVSILESTLFRLFVNLFLDRPISRENTVSAGAAHNHKRKKWRPGEKAFSLVLCSFTTFLRKFVLRCLLCN